MSSHIIHLTLFGLLAPFLHCANAQIAPVSGRYHFLGGRFIQCCGIAGPITETLPSTNQEFLQLSIVGTNASMKILGSDGTVFEIPPEGLRSGFRYELSNGVVFPDHVEFVAASAQSSYVYSVSNSGDALVMSGLLRLTCATCPDIPTDFTHTNVVAQLGGPLLESIQRVGNELRFSFTGQPGNDFFVEFTQSLPPSNWQVLTNYRAKIVSIQPVVTDFLTNSPARYYRIRQQDCGCD